MIEHYGQAAQFHLYITIRWGKCGFISSWYIDPVASAFSLPLTESYRRIYDFESEAGAYVAWGTQIETFLIWKISNGHWEIRCCDGATNNVFGIAAFIASDLKKIKERTEIVGKDFLGIPRSTGVQERIMMSITQSLPKPLQESRETLQEFNWEDLGLAASVYMYGKIKNYEIASLGALNEDERRALLIRYF